MHFLDGTRAAARFAAFFVLALPATLTAQKVAPEFTRQGVLVPNFMSPGGSNPKLGRRAADAVRSRLEKLIENKDVAVLEGERMRVEMIRSGFDENAPLTFADLQLLGRVLRADEYLMGEVSTAGGKTVLGGYLVLVRDKRLRQPLPTFSAAKLDDAAAQFARATAAARTQLVHQRRCENALRDGKGAQALASARQGLAAYAQSTLARTCLVWALRATHAPATEVLAVAQEILAIDSTAAHALESAAVSLDSLRRRPEAAAMWLRLASTDTANLELAERVTYALIDGGNSRVAEEFVSQLVDAHPDNLSLVRQKWRAAVENKSWKRALEAGEVMLIKDGMAQGDSSFHLRMATAYRASGFPLKAIATLAQAVTTFPGDVRLYGLYTQYVKAEADSALPRGLQLFPKSGDLLALQARELRSRGKLQESLVAARQAMSVDSSITQGQLMVAQVEMELGRPDSALTSLRRALARGEDTAIVAQFALSKGNTLYRAANGTGASNDFALALRFVALGDSLRASPQSHFLLGATALGVAHAALTEATKLTDKTQSCQLARLGVLEPYVGQQLTAFCGEPAQIDPAVARVQAPRPEPAAPR
jgi:tetratricopeptide (TPR) repeat protein